MTNVCACMKIGSDIQCSIGTCRKDPCRLTSDWAWTLEFCSVLVQVPMTILRGVRTIMVWRVTRQPLRTIIKREQSVFLAVEPAVCVAVILSDRRIHAGVSRIAAVRRWSCRLCCGALVGVATYTIHDLDITHEKLEMAFVDVLASAEGVSWIDGCSRLAWDCGRSGDDRRGDLSAVSPDRVHAEACCRYRASSCSVAFAAITLSQCQV
jgi:hypothetical protein